MLYRIMPQQRFGNTILLQTVDRRRRYSSQLTAASWPPFAIICCVTSKTSVLVVRVLDPGLLGGESKGGCGTK